MTDTRHPDIEIYVKNRSLDEIRGWLATHSEKIEAQSSKGGIHELDLSIDGVKVPVLIHEKVAGKAWSSVWFKSDQSPWAKDLDCAQAASEEMETQVRCIASGWADGDDPDEYWKVEAGESEKIQWHT
ncbi:hypothetical protein [uncultured Neptuniibacter sp.]|uniref:hypothetical protein n=1 Tax=uncultured Neptuniibacter sp. TaxID=502143 RepID=UPI002637B208|nr:hypothetical protein [uncultured Neptuniibacter sp.]